MSLRKKILIAVVIIISGSAAVLWILQPQKHHHLLEHITGETSFDVYPDAGKIHWLLLEQHGEHSNLKYVQIKGKTQREPVRLPIAQYEKIISRRSNDVQVAAAGKHIVAAWQISGSGYANRGPMRFAESIDDGKTWRLLPGPRATEQTDDQGFFDLLADQSENFHLVWLDVNGKAKGLRYAAYKNGSWSPAQTIDAVTCQCCWNTLAQDAAGNLFVLYRNEKPRDMAMATMHAGVWQKNGLVDNFNWHINVCPHAGGSLSAQNPSHLYAVTWTGSEKDIGCYFNKRVTSQNQWTDRKKFGNKSARNPDIAENGRTLAVVWDEFEGEKRFVKMMLSVDSGINWSSAKTISRSDYAASYPRVVATADGFYTFWTEMKNGVASIRHSISRFD